MAVSASDHNWCGSMRVALIALLVSPFNVAYSAPQITVSSPSSSLWTASKDVWFNVDITDPSEAYAFLDWEHSLVGWWRGEGDVNDSSGNGRDGTFMKGWYEESPVFAEGKFGQAFVFDCNLSNVSTYVDIGDDYALDFGKDDSFTIACWVYKEANAEGEVWSKGGNFKLFWFGTTRWQVRMGDNTAFPYASDSDPSGRWIHVAVVYDAATQFVKLYVDGVYPGGSTGANLSGNIEWSNRSSFRIGGAAGMSGNGHQGMIDEFMIFNRALCASEIAALYNVTAGNLEASFADLAEMTPYSYTVHAVNASGEHVSESGQITVDVPNTAPTGTITSLVGPIRSSSSSQTFTASAVNTNRDTTLTQATLYWNYGQAFGPTAYTDSLSGNADTILIPVSGLSNGTITWNLYVEDSAGNGGFIAGNQTLIIGPTDYYVAPYGSDAAPGTVDAPFATIQHFADIAYPGDTCYIRAGIYRETVTPARSGDAGAAITYRAYPGETVTINGANPLSSGWTQHAGHIYKTTAMNWDMGTGKNQVFVDGTAMMEARWPNSTDIMRPQWSLMRPGSTIAATSPYYVTVVDELNLTQPDDYWNGAIFHGSWQYTALTGIVTGYEVGTLTILPDIKPSLTSIHNMASGLGSPFYLSGVYGALDTAGEWYYNNATSTLYLWAPGNVDPATLTVEAKAREHGFDLDGKSYINIKNINLFACNVSTDVDSSYILMDNMDVIYVSHFTQIEETTWATGIVLEGNHNEIRNSTINFSAGNGVSLYGDYCTIYNCTITNTAYTVGYYAAVMAHGRYDTISHSTLYNSGYAIIYMSNAQNISVVYNDIHHNLTGQEVWDLGTVYAIGTNGKNAEIAYNKVHDFRCLGIYFDRECRNYRVHHNVVWNIFGTWRYPDGWRSGIHMNVPSEGMSIHHNTVAKLAKIVMNTDWTPPLLTGTTVQNNLASNVEGATTGQYGGVVVSNNIQTNRTNPSTIYQDYDANDFRLREGTSEVPNPARDAGQNLGYTHDIEGNPIVGAPDIGAFEYTATPTTCTIASSVTAVEGGTIAPSGTVTVRPGSHPTFTISAQLGYQIADVLVDGTSVGTVGRYIFNNIVGNHTIQASFVPRGYVAYVTAYNGSVTKTPQRTTYSLGETLTLQAVPNTGYHFDSWTGNLSGTSNPATLTMDSDKVVAANLAINTYTLSTTSASGSVIRTPDKALYSHGEVITLQGVPGAGRWFANWSGDLNGTGNPATLLMDSNKSVTANFTDIPPDSQPPRVTGCVPEPGAIQAPLNSLVTLHVSDDVWGVDANTVTVSVDGAVVYTGNVPSYSSALGVCRRIGAQADYTYAYQSNENFDFDQTIMVTVDAADLKGNVMPQYSYSFTTNMRAFGPNLKASSALGSLGKGSPATVHDGAGDIWVVWHAGATGQRDIYVSKLAHGSDSFGDAVQLTTGVGDECNPDMAIGTDDKLYIGWQDNRRGNWDIYARTSVDGVTWSEERRVTDSNDNQVNPAIAVDAQSPNRAYIAWQDDGAGNQDIDVAGSNDGFATKTISRVTSDASDQTDPQTAVDSSNTVYLVWTDRRNGSDDIYGASSGTGPWTNVPLVTGAGNQNSPAVATEAAGSVLHIAWVDDARGNQDIRYASSNGLPSNPLTGMSLIDDTTGAKRSPAVAAAGSADYGPKVFVCWRDERNITANGGDADLYFVEVRAGAETNILIGDEGAGSDQSEPVMGIDGYGYPYVVSTDNRNTAADIYYAGSTFMEPNALAAQLVGASAGGTVGTVPPIGVDDVSVVIPAGACPYDATVTITRIQNPRAGSALHVIAYDFGPSGLQFSLPVTIMIPCAVAEFGTDLPVPYWYDSRTGTVSQEGITDVETLHLSSSLNAIRFRTTHFTPYVLLPVSIAGGGDNGGGCALSGRGASDPYGYFVPFVILAVVMGILRLRGSGRCSTSHGYPRRGRT